jgi:hypothetical protein
MCVASFPRTRRRSSGQEGRLVAEQILTRFGHFTRALVAAPLRIANQENTIKPNNNKIKKSDTIKKTQTPNRKHKSKY